MQKTATARRSGSPRRKPRSYHCSPRSWLPRPNLPGSLSKRQDLGDMPLPRSLLQQVPAKSWSTSSVNLPEPESFLDPTLSMHYKSAPLQLQWCVLQLMSHAVLAEANSGRECSDQGPLACRTNCLERKSCGSSCALAVRSSYLPYLLQGPANRGDRGAGTIASPSRSCSVRIMRALQFPADPLTQNGIASDCNAIYTGRRWPRHCCSKRRSTRGTARRPVHRQTATLR